MLLIDNAHTPLGRQLVEPLLRQRAAGARDRIAVFASSRVRDHEGLSHAVRRRLPEVAHGSRWSRGTGVTSGILAVELTPLDPEQVRSAFDRHDRAGRIPAGLARGVHRLTGGRPLAVELLALAAGEAAEPASLVPGSLLDLMVEVREDRAPAQVADELLTRLLPGAEQRLDFLSVLAAAHGEDSARLLAGSRLGRGAPDGDVALRMRDALRADDWPVGPGHFVADPLLRSLLLHRLRFQDGDHPSYAVWQAVHVSLRGAYAPVAATRASRICCTRSWCWATRRRAWDICGCGSTNRTYRRGSRCCASSPRPRTRAPGGPSAPIPGARSRSAGRTTRCREGSNRPPPSCTYCCAGCCTAYGCCPIRWPCRTKR